MPWFRVCDTLPDHPKAISAKLEAIGLWTLAGAERRVAGLFSGKAVPR